MNVKVFFDKTNKVIPFNNQHQMNGFIHAILGQENDYHDKFSNYSISSILGGKMAENKAGLVYENEPYIIASSQDNDFINAFLFGLVNAISNKSADFFGLYPTRFETGEYRVGKTFDVVRTNSPILLKNADNRKITSKDDNWLDILKKQTIKKLENAGIVDDTFYIVVKKQEALKTKMVMVGDVFNPCTNAVFTVYGKEDTRKAIYALGFGNSTGSGFGSVSPFTI